MNVRIEIRVNGLYSLYIPAEGIDIRLKRNEFDLLTNSTAENRPLYITQTFELPLDENRHIFDRLKGLPKTCQLLFNDTVVMSGYLFEYSVDEQRKVVLVTVTSAFKEMVDYLGDNVLYLDKIDLSRWDYLIPETFSASQSNDLLKFGYYNPMDTNTGAIEFNPSNINDFCKPSLNLAGYFREAFRLNGWTANWDAWTDKMKAVCLMPTTAYTCSSWCFSTSGKITVPAGGTALVELSSSTQKWNITSFIRTSLLRRDMSPMSLSGWSAYGGSAYDPIIEDGAIRCTYNAQAGSSYYGGIYSSSMNFTPGSRLRMTFMAKASANDSVVVTGFNLDSGALYGRVDVILSSEWKKYTIEVTNNYAVNVNKVHFYPLYNTAQQGYYYIKDVVVEEGHSVPGAEILSGNRIQCRQPNRLTSFKLKALYKCPDAFDFVIREGANEMAFIPSLGDERVSYVTDNVNLKEGLDPLSVILSNPNPYDIEIDFSGLTFQNLFSIYETNEDEYLAPAGYMFPVAENYPKLTPLEIYREICTLFQMAQTSEDEVRHADFYFINDIPAKGYTKVDVNPYLFWNGFEILSDDIEGLAKINAIRYKDDKKRQRYFRADISSLPSNGVYFESVFAHAETNNGWNAAQIPALKYKVKSVQETITVGGEQIEISTSFEYLEYSDVTPQIGYYDGEKMTFQPLHITTIVNEYWGRFLAFLSSSEGYNPVVYQLKLRLSYYQYVQLFAQRNLFYYLSDCMQLEGEYDVLNQTFTGTFISLR